MKSFVRNALLGAAGLIVVSLPAYAASSTVAGNTPLLKSTTTKPMQMTQRNANPGGGMYRNENPGGGMYQNENPGGGMFRNENPGGMYKKSKKPKHKTAKK